MLHTFSKNLLCFIRSNQTPDYLHELVPPCVSDITNYNLRNRQNINIPLNRLSVYQQSYFPSCIDLWNKLDLNIRQNPTFLSFKLQLQKMYFQNAKPPKYYFYGDRVLSILHARLRNKCSALRADLYRANLVNDAYCTCGYMRESVEHFLLYCNNFRIQRIVMLNELTHLDLPLTLDLLLFGNENLDFNDNVLIFSSVHKFIKETKRFST